MRRLRGWFQRHQFLSALIVFIVVAVPGYVRLEQVAQNAHDAAERVAKVEADREADRIERAGDACKRAVSARDDNRAMWLFLFEQFAGGPNVPIAAEALDRLLPPLECTADNVPTPITGG